MNRKEMEDLFRAWGLEFHQQCCFDSAKVYAELVQIGESDAPWYCSEEYLYKVFEFRHEALDLLSKRGRTEFGLDPEDMFTGTVTEQAMLGGCL